MSVQRIFSENSRREQSHINGKGGLQGSTYWVVGKASQHQHSVTQQSTTKFALAVAHLNQSLVDH